MFFDIISQMSKNPFNKQKLKKLFKPDVLKAYEIRNSVPDIHKNTLDVFSAALDAKLLSKTTKEWISDVENPRQTQKSNQNWVGYMHQAVLGSIDGWRDLGTGEGVDLESKKNKIIAELKNKHNTMKGDAKINIYDDLEKCLKTTNKGFTGYYVEILPKNAKRYNTTFEPPDKKTKLNRPKREDIRIIDGASFYEKVTGQKDAIKTWYLLFQIIVDEILQENINGYSKTSLGKESLSIFIKTFGD